MRSNTERGKETARRCGPRLAVTALAVAGLLIGCVTPPPRVPRKREIWPRAATRVLPEIPAYSNAALVFEAGTAPTVAVVGDPEIERQRRESLARMQSSQSTPAVLATFQSSSQLLAVNGTAVFHLEYLMGRTGIGVVRGAVLFGVDRGPDTPEAGETPKFLGDLMKRIADQTTAMAAKDKRYYLRNFEREQKGEITLVKVLQGFPGVVNSDRAAAMGFGCADRVKPDRLLVVRCLGRRGVGDSTRAGNDVHLAVDAYDPRAGERLGSVDAWGRCLVDASLDALQAHEELVRGMEDGTPEQKAKFSLILREHPEYVEVALPRLVESCAVFDACRNIMAMREFQALLTNAAPRPAETKRVAAGEMPKKVDGGRGE